MPITKRGAPAKDTAYDDPELDAIVREVLATTTEEDVRRAYETLEAETTHRVQTSSEGHADVGKGSRKSHSLFRHDKK